MSGSGPSVFSIFDSMEKARDCEEKLKAVVSDVFVVEHKKK